MTDDIDQEYPSLRTKRSSVKRRSPTRRAVLRCVRPTMRLKEAFAVPSRSLRRSLGGVRIALSVVPIFLGASGCAHVPTDPQQRAEYELANDPIEPGNRTVFAANRFVDRYAVKPVAETYKEHVPMPVRTGIHNFFRNLDEPIVALNDLLQGNLNRSWNTVQRFAINTTVGGLGLFDRATDWDRPAHQANFGQTLGVWGFGTGPSLQLPFFGPSDVRDTIGKVIGALANPIPHTSGGAEIAVNATDLVEKRADLLPTTNLLEKTSLDYYATLRNVTAQKRAALVREGKAGLITKQKTDELDNGEPMPTNAGR